MLGNVYGAGLPVTRERTPSSRVLEDLLRQAPTDHFTLGWVFSTLHQRSFGVVMLFLGVLATAPIGSSVPGICCSRGGPDDCGASRTRFSSIYHCPEAADAISFPPGWARHSGTTIS